MSAFALSAARRPRARGMTLIEMLVAMVIGLIMLGAVGYLFVGSQKTSLTQSDLMRMQESARNTMDVTGRALRQAGYKLDVTQAMNGAALGGTDGGQVSGQMPASDTLTVYHDPKWANDASAPLKGEEVDCEGVTVTSNSALNITTGLTPPNTNMVAYRLYVSGNKLYCSNKPTDLTDAGVVVANNVENMQVTYGMRSGGQSEVIDSYKALPASAEEFKSVASVRISVLLRGTTPNLVPGNRQALMFGGVKTVHTDGFLRQVYSSTFNLRNQSR
jgi:type IV pilus assembly protein PilW